MARRSILRLVVKDYRSVDVPFFKGVKRGFAYAQASSLVDEKSLQLDEWVEVNPRRVKRSKKDKSKPIGSVVSSIMETLSQEPELFPLKSNGIYISACDVDFIDRPTKVSLGAIKVVLGSKDQHGLLNGATTFATLKYFASLSNDSDQPNDLSDVWVPIHFYIGIPAEHIPSIADGLNTSSQVTDASIMNLAGAFDPIKKVLKRNRSPEVISYMENDSGIYKIEDVVLRLFALYGGFPPSALYRNPGKALEEYENRLAARDPLLLSLIESTHDIMVLFDSLNSFAFIYGKRWERDRASGQKGYKDPYPHRRKYRRGDDFKPLTTPQQLPFIGVKLPASVHPAWTMSMLESLRPNVVGPGKNGPDTYVDDWLVLAKAITPKVMRKLDAFVNEKHMKPEDISRSKTEIDSLNDIVVNVLIGKFKADIPYKE